MSGAPSSLSALRERIAASRREAASPATSPPPPWHGEVSIAERELPPSAARFAALAALRAAPHSTRAWASYLRSASDGAPPGARIPLLRLYTRATRILPITAANRHDHEYLALWLTLAEMQAAPGDDDAIGDARATFKLVKMQRIGLDNPTLYLAWAAVEERAANFSKAARLRADAASCRPLLPTGSADTHTAPTPPPSVPGRSTSSVRLPPTPMSESAPRTPFDSRPPRRILTPVNENAAEPFNRASGKGQEFEGDIRNYDAVPSADAALSESPESRMRDAPVSSFVQRDSSKLRVPPLELSSLEAQSHERRCLSQAHEPGTGSSRTRAPESESFDRRSQHDVAMITAESQGEPQVWPHEGERSDHDMRALSPESRNSTVSHNSASTPGERYVSCVDHGPSPPALQFSAARNQGGRPFIGSSRKAGSEHENRGAAPHPMLGNKGLSETKARGVSPASANTSMRVHGSALRQGQTTSSSDNVITVNRKPYRVLECVGKGGSSKVYKVVNPEGQTYALKRVRVPPSSRAALESYANEIDLLQSLQGRSSIVQLFDAEVRRSHGLIHLVMEFGDIDLARLLSRHTKEKSMDDGLRRQYWSQMLTAVNTIHEQKIVHSDLKPANFLHIGGTLKLIDFGIAKAIQTDDTTKIVRDSQIGTPNYMSPEALMAEDDDGEDTSTDSAGACNAGDLGRDGNERKPRPRRYRVGRASDIWSLGCILYQMVYGRTPFAHIKNTIHKLNCIQDPSYEISFPSSVHVPDPLLEVMRGCLQRDPSKRLGMSRLMSHPYYAFADREDSAGRCGCRSGTISDAARSLILRMRKEGVPARDIAHIEQALRRLDGFEAHGSDENTRLRHSGGLNGNGGSSLSRMTPTSSAITGYDHGALSSTRFMRT